ncbi:pseudouridylate synthase [Chitinibacter bivalviorum]|uniref:tRNA pseudouridine synthase C n=2 Tax=Chitinibacter bivalviorum TaxID=2739434 RepID=A0A7H9BMD3_9NEIS|nr:pseudouridylate synthase [Chitinibacter bivalviorum]
MLPILYRDPELIAIHKPSNLLVHKTDLDFFETEFALQKLRDQIGQHVYPIHRLDKATSGALLFALNSDMARLMGEAFSERRVDKSYLALVRGWADESGLIEHALSVRQDDVDPRSNIDHKAPQEAATHYRSLAQFTLNWEVERYPTSRYALLALNPITGRRHQIRRHLKHISHPIIGDSTYGKGRHNRAFAEAFEVDRLLLACTGLDFIHPRTQQKIELRCPLAGDFAHVIAQLDGLDALRKAGMTWDEPTITTPRNRTIWV